MKNRMDRFFSGLEQLLGLPPAWEPAFEGPQREQGELRQFALFGGKQPPSPLRPPNATPAQRQRVSTGEGCFARYAADGLCYYGVVQAQSEDYLDILFLANHSVKLNLALEAPKNKREWVAEADVYNIEWALENLSCAGNWKALGSFDNCTVVGSDMEGKVQVTYHDGFEERIPVDRLRFVPPGATGEPTKAPGQGQGASVAPPPPPPPPAPRRAPKPEGYDEFPRDETMFRAEFSERLVCYAPHPEVGMLCLALVNEYGVGQARVDFYDEAETEAWVPLYDCYDVEFAYHNLRCFGYRKEEQAWVPCKPVDMAEDPNSEDVVVRFERDGALRDIDMGDLRFTCPEVPISAEAIVFGDPYYGEPVDNTRPFKPDRSCYTARSTGDDWLYFGICRELRGNQVRVEFTDGEYWLPIEWAYDFVYPFIKCKPAALRDGQYQLCKMLRIDEEQNMDVRFDADGFCDSINVRDIIFRRPR